MLRIMGAMWPFFALCFLAIWQQPPRQEPQPPFPYLEEEVSYSNPEARNVTLAGTFTAPATGGPFPAVLLISGAGPQDRDETIAGHKPFLVLSDFLTRRGIAVLRVDDRGTGASTGSFEKSTTEDFASDAEAGVRYLLQRKDVNARHIGLIGHGEGAIVAGMVAVKMPQQVSFLVLLAGTAVPGEQVLLLQTERSEKAAHIPEDQIKADKKIGTMLYDLVKEGRSEAALHQALLSLPQEERLFIAPWQRQLRRLKSPWLRFFLSYDPATALEKIKCPVLALEGEKDLQVIPDQNVRAMKAAFARGGNRDATVQVLPGLNYMFQTARTGLGYEYETIPETISPVALNRIGDWIQKHTS
jgi:pimeloyl-ACP methyl ester carboxylesterase